MKKLLIGFSILLISLWVVGCSDDIDIIKDGTMSFNQTTTVGKTLDNWSDCEDGKWIMFEANNDVRVVEFTCNRKIEDKLDMLQQRFNKDKHKKINTVLGIKYIKNKFQFTINQDDSFQINSMEMRIYWEDGTQYRKPLNATRILKIAYANGDSMADFFNKGLDGALMTFSFLYSRGEKELGVL